MKSINAPLKLKPPDKYQELFKPKVVKVVKKVNKDNLPKKLFIYNKDLQSLTITFERNLEEIGTLD